MTSASLSLAERDRKQPTFLTVQANLIQRRLWPAALSFLIFMLYHVIGVIMVTNICVQESRSLNPEQAHTQLSSSLIRLLGRSVVPGYLAAATAMILAIQGFAWLDDRRQIDFYSSQPISGIRRFTEICTSSFIIFALSYILTLTAGIIIGASFGGITAPQLPAIWIGAGKCAALFLAVHGIAVLAVMLTGNVIISILASFVLLFYEPGFRFVLSFYQDQYLDLPSHLTGGVSLTRAVFSPLWHYTVGSETNLRKILMNLLIAVCVTTLAFFVYSIRKNEAAGSAVIFRPVRIIVKIAIAVLGALCISIISLNGSTENFSMFCIVIAAVIIGCIMEIIYAFDLKAMFRHFPETVAAAVLALFIFVVFAFDIFGIRTWMPKAVQLESAAVIDQNYFSDHFTDDGMPVTGPTSDFYVQYMKITDNEALLSFVRACYEETAADDSAPTYSITVYYRLKNGRKVARKVPVPESIDPALADAVFGSEDFREGYFQVWHDTYIRSAVQEKGSMIYDNGVAAYAIEPSQYMAFREAYMKDLEQFSYSFANNNWPAGTMHIYCTKEAEHEYSVHVSCPVYGTFTNMEAFLKKNGAVLSVKDDISIIGRLEIIDEKATSVDSPVIVEDPEKIRDILDRAHPETTGPVFCWAKVNNANWNYRIVLYTKEGSVYHDRLNGSFPENEAWMFFKSEEP